MGSRADRYQYLGLMAACAAVTLPLETVLGARVWRRPRRLARALLPGIVGFGAWDVVAIGRGHWSFNPRTTTGWCLRGRLPVEEVVFFVVVPTCALLTLEAVRRLLPGDRPGDRAG
ncbi:MAG: lycopene cyclase domain-containing protein [Acidimicrobiales bacterium]